MAQEREGIALPALLGSWTALGVREVARRCGYVRRDRKKEVWVLLWVLVLGFGVGARSSLADLHHLYCRSASTAVSMSAFQKWFTVELVVLLKQIVRRLLAEQPAPLSTQNTFLHRFDEVLAIDSTVIHLHSFLARHYPASNHEKAAAKLHTVINVLDASLKKVVFTGQRTADSQVHQRLGPWVQGKLLLFDLGYFSHSLFKRIDDNGGFFVSRVKANANPRIIADHHTGSGRHRPLVGQKLRPGLVGLKRDLLDLTVEVEVKKRAYRGKRRTQTWQLRLLGQRRPDGSYFLYYTNVPAEDLSADDICAVYALRWQIELLFACLKGHLRLGQGDSQRREVVEARLWAALLAHLVSRSLFRWARRLVPQHRHMPLRRFAHLFARVALALLDLVLCPLQDRAHRLLEQILRDAPDPNRKRTDRAVLGIPMPPDLDLLQPRTPRGLAA